jgi:plasmid stability protein
MATLYVREVPDELYAALRERAEEEGRSISAEAVSLLKRALEDVAEERPRREAHRAALKRMREISDSITLPAGYPDSVELLREDRAR